MTSDVVHSLHTYKVSERIRTRIIQKTFFRMKENVGISKLKKHRNKIGNGTLATKLNATSTLHQI